MKMVDGPVVWLGPFGPLMSHEHDDHEHDDHDQGGEEMKRSARWER